MDNELARRHEKRRLELNTWLGRRHGVAHTSEARGAGFTTHEIADLVAHRLARRVRRSWLVTPDCDAGRVDAAAMGGRVTCVTAAKRMGLVVPESAGTHVAVASNASRLRPEGVVLHWARGPAPVGRHHIDDPVLNILFQAARCLDRSDALALWESAIRKKKVDPSLLRRVGWGSTKAQELASVASELSDSGLESRFFEGMRGEGVAVRRQVRLDGRNVDGLIGRSLVIQLDGFAFHSDPAARRRDIAADARLVLRGYTVFRFDFVQVFFEWETVLETIRMAIAQNLHLNEVR
jgi:very-short-patch-repair endonuclease